MVRSRLPALWDPFEPLRLRSPWEELWELESWVEDPFLLAPRPERLVRGGLQQVMAMDISETDDALQIRMTLPGVRPEDVQVEERNGVLRIRAEQKEEADRQEGRWLVRERRYGHWERAIRLPDNVDLKHIRADYANGVLTITVPKKEKGRGFLKGLSVSLPRFRLPLPRREEKRAASGEPVKIKVKTK